MNQNLGLKILSQIMKWPDDHANDEFRWLKLMSRLKYDGYHDFQAGMRFVENLATWLQQFKQKDRETAYTFIRQALIYIGPGEMRRLVEKFYPQTVCDRLIRTVGAEQGVPYYRVFTDTDACAALKRLQRETLFMGLSDGARIDTLRHVNSKVFTNEQMVVATQIDNDKWRDLVEKLREDLHDQQAQFRIIYLVDDFAGSGSTLLRRGSENSEWMGKLIRFKNSVENAQIDVSDGILSSKWDLCIHHYVASTQAEQTIKRRLNKAHEYLNCDGWANGIHVSFGIVLPDDLRIDNCSQNEFLKLTNDYYDPSIRNEHTDVGGTSHLGLGYGDCALPLVLDHNTPNNSVALLWAETEGNHASAMRPLFRRRERHI